MKFQSKLWNYTILDQFEIITEEFRPVWNLPRNTVDEKIKKSSWTMCHQKRGQIGGRDSLGDCDNICEGNLVFRVIFGNFIHRWFQICAQLGSYNVSFSHYRPLKLKYDFLGGSFSRLTSQSQAGERTPKKAIFQLWRSLVWKKCLEGPKLGTYLESALHELSKNHPEN